MENRVERRAYSERRCGLSHSLDTGSIHSSEARLDGTIHSSLAAAFGVLLPMCPRLLRHDALQAEHAGCVH